MEGKDFQAGSGGYNDNNSNEKAEMEKQRAIMAIGHARDFFDFLNRPYNPPEDLKKLCAQVFLQSSDLNNMIDRIDNYVDGKVFIPGTKTPFEDPYRHKRFIRYFKNTLLIKWNEWVNSLEPGLQVAARDFGFRDFPFTFRYLHPDFFMDALSGGQLILVIGEKGSGKTDWALTLGRMALDKKWIVISNVELKKSITGYIFTQKFSRMILEICKAKLNNTRVLLILDEAGIVFPSYESTTNVFKQLDKLAKLFRKFGVEWIYITQYETQVPTTFRLNFAAWHKKHRNKKDLSLVLNSGEGSLTRSILISDIPPTDMPFDTFHISYMDIDVNVDEVMTYLSGLAPGLNQFDALRLWMEKRIADLASGEVVVDRGGKVQPKKEKRTQD